MAITLRDVGAVIIGTLIAAAASGLAFSRAYWGYWTEPPSIKPWVEHLQAADGVVFLECQPNTAAAVKELTAEERHRSAEWYRGSSRDYPGYQVLAAVEATRLPISTGVLTPADANKACTGLFESGAVVAATPGYGGPYARYIRGFLVDGRTRSGERVWIMSAIGGAISNDHHPVYDVQFSDNGAVRRVHVYYEDIAGIEGVRWYVVAGVVFVAGTLFLAALFIVVSSGRFAARRLGRLAANIRARDD